MMITITGLTKCFGNRVLIDHFSVSLPSVGLVGITGPSGCGKTTLLSILGGLDDDFSGSVSVAGFQVSGSNEKARCSFRQKTLGFVFQDFRLFPLDTVENNVMLPLSASSSLSSYLQKKKVADLLDLVGLSGYQKHMVTTLSGGEKQRVALARALVNDPEVILADEPTGALDETNGRLALDLLKKIASTRLVIIISHEKALLEERSDILISFGEKEISVQKKVVDKVIAKPLPILKTPYSAAKSRI
ncbi:MAG: ATP-binding cassette domain-containing protein, partial [Firmicutes bacterium]|nr:ATP-binding cassette domain-containing protein [Bacillota bacterium]